MRIAENIRDKRTNNGLTQQEVADKLFVTRQCISRWEQGKTLPDINNIEKLALIYNCKIEDLLDDNSMRDITLKSNSKVNRNRVLNYVALSLFSITLVFSIIAISISLNRQYEEYHINAIITEINETKSTFTVTEESDLEEYTFDVKDFKDVTFMSKVSNSIISNEQLELNDTVEIYFTKDITSRRITKVRVVDKYVNQNFMGVILIANGEEYNSIEDIPSNVDGIRYYYLDDLRVDRNFFGRHVMEEYTGSEDEKRINLEILYDNPELINDIKVGLIYESGIVYVDSISEPKLTMPIYIGEHSFSVDYYSLHSYQLTIQVNFMPVDSFDLIDIYEYDKTNTLIQSSTYSNYNSLVDHSTDVDTLYAYIKVSKMNQNSLELEMVTKLIYPGDTFEVYSSDSYGFVTIYTVKYN